MVKNIRIEIYKWEGKFLFFKIKSKCGECSLNIRIIKHVIEDFKKIGINIDLIEKPWLDNWYKIIFKGGYHAPIVILNGKVIKQENVLTIEELKDKIIKEYVKNYKPEAGVHIFSLPDCPFCLSAKKLLKEKHYLYTDHDVLNNSLEMQKMIKIVKGKVHPITLPQIFIDSKRIGGYDDLIEYFKN